MKLLRTYRKTPFFLWINITGLAIGLAASIMLVLFTVNELSYDRHFPNYERILCLNTVEGERGAVNQYPINLRAAYTELPAKVPGIEAAVQIYDDGNIDMSTKEGRMQGRMLYVDPEFFRVFGMNFIDGDPATALTGKNSAVLARPTAQKLFGSAVGAVGQPVKVGETEYMVTAVVEELPGNTHFSFDAVVDMDSFAYLDWLGGLEFHTFYLAAKESPLDEVRENIETEYGILAKPFGEAINSKISGATIELKDVYFSPTTSWTLGKHGSMAFIWLLSALSLFILLFAVSNFVNLFIAHGETRMNEIGIRKANGAGVCDIVRQFFSEVSYIVLIAFVLAFVLTVIVTPYFSKLIGKSIDLSQLANPWFIACCAGLFIVTVILSASYPSLYLSRFSPLDILGKKVMFSKRRLSTVVTIIQSAITIVLLTMILMVNRQAAHLRNIPVGYNPENVLSVLTNRTVRENYEPLRDELLSLPDVVAVSGSHHVVGGGGSGQTIGPLGDDSKIFTTNEYRFLTGMFELMELEFVDGKFFSDDTPKKPRPVILNEAAAKKLELEYPYAGQSVNYNDDEAIVTGVVKDFLYEDVGSGIQPIVFNWVPVPALIYIKFADVRGRAEAEATLAGAFRKFDPDFVISPIWAEDIYMEKFETINIQSKVIFTGSLLSILLAMMGLAATHIYNTVRRTKEIGIRRVNGAQSGQIFTMLAAGILKWVLVAGIIATPVSYLVSSRWLDGYSNHTAVSWWIFVVPVVAMIVVSILVTSGVTFRVARRNPVESVKSE